MLQLQYDEESKRVTVPVDELVSAGTCMDSELRHWDFLQEVDGWDVSMAELVNIVQVCYPHMIL